MQAICRATNSRRFWLLRGGVLSAFIFAAALAAGQTPSTSQPPPAPATTAAPAAGAVLDLQVWVMPTTVPVGFNESSGELSVVLSNLSDRQRSFRIELSSLQHKAGTASARTSFPDLGGTNWAEVSVAGKTLATHKIRVEQLTHLGTYEGALRVRTTVPSATETVRTMQVVRRSAGFELIFSGQNIANGVLTLKPMSEHDRKFSLAVENPVTSGDADVTVEVVAEFGGREKTVSLKAVPSKFVLLPGVSQTIQLELGPPPPSAHLWCSIVRWTDDCQAQRKARSQADTGAEADFPASGDFIARVRFKEANGPVKHLDVRLQPSFVPMADWSWIIALVALGAVLSALVGAAIPNLTTRRKLRSRLTSLRETVSVLPEAEQYAKAALARELHRVNEALYEAQWFTPTASDRLAEQALKLTELEERGTLLIRVSEHRLDTQTSGDIPSSARARLNRELDVAAAAIAKATVEIARAKLDEAATDIAASRSASALRLAIDAGIAALPETAPPDSSSVMTGRLTKLRAAYSALGQAPADETLLDLDYQCQCAQLYFLRYLGEVVPNHVGTDMTAAGADLVSLLSRGRSAYIEAVALVESLQLGVTRQAFEEALDDIKSKATVAITPLEPKGGEAVTFRLLFNEDLLNKSPLLRRTEVRWTFDAGAPEAFGAKVGQYFRAATKSRVVRYRVSVGPGSGRTTEGSLTLSGTSLWSRLFAQAEAVSFLITMTGAVALALLAKYADARPLESIQDYINPFLWGFGLDRMKSLVGSRS